MRSLAFILLCLVALSVSATRSSAQMAWQLTGGNGATPVAFTYTVEGTHGNTTGGTVNGSGYFHDDEDLTIISASRQQGWLSSSPILSFEIRFQDGGNAAAQTVTSSGGGNLFIELTRTGATPVLVSDGAWEFSMTIPTAPIGGAYATSYTYAGGSDAGLSSAFNFAFDGNGKITMTTTGNYTHSGDNTQYFAVNLTAVPEPATTVLIFSLFVGGVALWRRRSRT